jgi:hypothetical protein
MVDDRRRHGAQRGYRTCIYLCRADGIRTCESLTPSWIDHISMDPSRPTEQPLSRNYSPPQYILV